MFSRSIIDDSRSIIDDSRSIIDDSRSIIDDSRSIIDDRELHCGITYNCHSYDSKKCHFER
jgi:hypothetical protein